MRMLKCQWSGEDFEYSGRGRPPKYHPKHRKAVIAAQRKSARVAKKVALATASKL